MIFPTVSGMLDAMKSIPVVGNGLDMSHSHWSMEALLMPRVMGEWEEMGVTRCHRVAHLDQITSMRPGRDTWVTGGTGSAESYHTTAMSGSGEGGGGDGMLPRCLPRPDHQHAPDDRRHG